MLADVLTAAELIRAQYVLILVLLEYARRLRIMRDTIRAYGGLNPCFTGICSPTQYLPQY